MASLYTKLLWVRFIFCGVWVVTLLNKACFAIIAVCPDSKGLFACFPLGLACEQFLTVSLGDKLYCWPHTFFFWDRVSLGSPGCPRTHSVASNTQSSACLCLSSAGIEGRWHRHFPVTLLFFYTHFLNTSIHTFPSAPIYTLSLVHTNTHIN